MTEYLIEHQCPQCGAPAVLTETDRIFDCRFCRVKSCLSETPVFRYIIPSNAPLDKKIIYVPYWHFKGTVFSLTKKEMGQRILDISHLATEEEIFPPTLGLRPQALKMRFIHSEIPGDFLSPKKTMEDILPVMSTRAKLIKNIDDLVYQNAVGEVFSLIYAPYYVEETLYDAVLNKPVPGMTTSPEAYEKINGKPAKNRLRFIPTICPHCGWDMAGEADTISLACRNCNTIWRPGAKGFVKTPFSVVPEKGENIHYLPFWRVRAEFTGLIMDTYADLARFANIPRAEQKEWKTRQPCFWIPAYRSTPQAFLRAAVKMTLSSPDEETTDLIPDAPLVSVTLPVQEAVKSLLIITADMAMPKQKFLSRLQHIEARPVSANLIFIPFQKTHHEFISTRMRFSLHRSMLKAGF